jgi:hypothetical protein
VAAGRQTARELRRGTLGEVHVLEDVVADDEVEAIVLELHLLDVDRDVVRLLRDEVAADVVARAELH